MDEALANFMSITDCSQQKAEQYLRISENNLEQALQLFFEGIEIDGPGGPPASTNVGGRAAPIAVDDDEEMDLQHAIRSSRDRGDDDDSMRGFQTGFQAGDIEDDAAIARRLQEEFNGTQDGVRAPIARTRETLVGPDDDFIRRAMPSARGPRAGIFNQRAPAPSVWDPESTSDRRRALAEATGGASESSSKSNRLAEMYRPPYEILSHLDFADARDEARETEKWILVNIQEQGNFQCQILNRDIWKAKEVVDTIRENFIFLQYDRAGTDGREYLRLYMPHALNIPIAAQTTPFPHIAIIDPRTGEKVKEWSGPPKDALSFVMDVHDFLSRFSLEEHARNPVTTQAMPSPKIVDVDSLTEDEMLRIAMQNSLDGDATGLTSPTRNGKRKMDEDDTSGIVDLSDSDKPTLKRVESAVDEVELSSTSAFATIPALHHEEPAPNAPGSTRIQFRFHDGSRVVRRFLLQDTVQRIYQWLKADLIPEKFPGDASKDFELVSIGTKLIEKLGSTIEEAGLRNGTVMVAVVSED